MKVKTKKPPDIIRLAFDLQHQSKVRNGSYLSRKLSITQFNFESKESAHFGWIYLRIVSHGATACIWSNHGLFFVLGNSSGKVGWDEVGLESFWFIELGVSSNQRNGVLIIWIVLVTAQCVLKMKFRDFSCKFWQFILWPWNFEHEKTVTKMHDVNCFSCDIFRPNLYWYTFL